MNLSIQLAVPLITMWAAAGLILLQTLLMMNTGFARAGRRISIGDGGDTDMARRVRQHGNLAENAAIFLIGLALLELAVGDHIIVLVLAILFGVARLSHAIGFQFPEGNHPLRAVGAILTLLSMFGLVGALLWQLLG